MSPVGRRWVAGSFRSSIDFNTTINDFHFSFILKFFTEESSSPVSEKYMETCFSSDVAGGSPTLKIYMEIRPYKLHSYRQMRVLSLNCKC